MGSVGAPLLLPLPRAGSQPSLPSDHQPGIHGLITKIATLVGQAQPALAKHPFAEDTSSKNFFLMLIFLSRYKEEKRRKMGVGWGPAVDFCFLAGAGREILWGASAYLPKP